MPLDLEREKLLISVMESSSIQTVNEFLRVNAGLCSYCVSLVVADDDSGSVRQKVNNVDVAALLPEQTGKMPSPLSSSSAAAACSVCFGLSSPQYLQDHIVPLIFASLSPYCEGGVGNYVTKESPTLNIPLLIAVRAQCAIAAAESFIQLKIIQAQTDTAAPGIRLHSAEEVYSKLKEHLRSSIREVIDKSISLFDNVGSQQPNLTHQLHEEESGYLAAHVLILPNFISGGSEDSSSDLSYIVPPSFQSHINKHRNQIELAHHRILNPRKRFRGNDPTLKQGGDPRANLELRVRRMSQSDNTSLIAWLERGTVNEWLRNEVECKDSSLALSSWLQKTKNSQIQPCVHAAIWRRPFYVFGTYTKARRDISQSPFWVSDTTGLVRKKGVSSVEEEICPPLARCCGGISDKNNECVLATAAVVKDVSVVFGCCKFHASGREDMDVRMILPAPSVKSRCNKLKITGRPFVCEVFDAFRLPTATDLEAAVKEINHSSCCNDGGMEEINHINGWPKSLVGQDRFYGCNPNGVGVSSPLELTCSRSFSSLQAETEEKVKYYGCICWTSVLIRSNEELVKKLGCLPWDQATSDEEKEHPNFPLHILQETPLRVLHRRSSDKRSRYILSLWACRISDHWIRLRMCTSAGTYVKEFCHGDCGRTQPSISSLLGGRVDITELDCEGIESNANLN